MITEKSKLLIIKQLHSTSISLHTIVYKNCILLYNTLYSIFYISHQSINEQNKRSEFKNTFGYMKNIFNFRNAILGTLGTVSLTACASQPTQQQNSPNVIYVFPDQFRNHALSFWGEEGFSNHVNFTPDPTHTPVLNKFAKESVVLTSAMSNFPLSSPHRGMLLTGMYPDGSGITLNCNSERPFSSLRQDIETISDVYFKAGYDCGYIGKLHAEHPTPNDPDRPGKYVEDRIPAWDAYTIPENRHHFNYWYSYGTFDVHKEPHYWDTEGNRHEIKEWSPKHEADKAIEYISNANNTRDPNKPFFLMVGMNPPHSPYHSLEDVMEEDYNLYKDVDIDSLLIRPNADKNLPKAKEATPYYFASVTGVDREFGRILAELEKQGLTENTIVVFASDHGETMCSQGTDDPKNSPYTESMNIPFIVRYPGKLNPHVDNLLMSSPDIMPTLLGLSGLDDLIPTHLDGRNFAPLFFEKENNIERPKGAIYIQNINGDKDENGLVKNYFPSARGIKTADYTLALFINKQDKALSRVFLFDDKNDPYQLNNLDRKENKELFNQLCQQLAELLKETDDRWYQERILSDIIPYN